MSETAAPVEIYLRPGEFHFGGGNVRVHTLLGSCVSIAVWHPVLRIGGMCHFMLPSRWAPQADPPDGHFADEAMKLFLREIGRYHTHPGDYHVKLFGGGNMFKKFGAHRMSDVAERNIEAARFQLQINGFPIHAENVGGCGYRSIVFDLRDGNVWVKHEKISAALASCR